MFQLEGKHDNMMKIIIIFDLNNYSYNIDI